MATTATATRPSAAARIFVSASLSGYARAIRALSTWQADHPDVVSAAVEFSTVCDEWQDASPENLPDLRVVIDNAVWFDVPIGSTERSILNRLDREWKLATLPEGSAAR